MPEKNQKEEIAAVLSPEQHDQVAKLASDAKGKRSKKSPMEPGTASTK